MADLISRMSLDPSQFNAAIASAQQAVTRLAGSAAETSAALGALGAQTGAAGTAAGKTQQQTKGLAGAQKDATATASEFGRQLALLPGPLGTVGGLAASLTRILIGPGGLALAAAGAGSGLVALGVSLSNDIERLDNLKRATGLSVSALQALEQAAREAGEEPTALARGFGRLSIAMGDVLKGNDETARSFQRMGVDLQGMVVAGASTEEVIEAVAKALAGTQDQLVRSTREVDIFGGRTRAMGSALDQIAKVGFPAYIEQMRQAGIVTDATTVQMARQVDKGLDQLTRAWDALVLSLKARVIPTLAELLQMLKLIPADAPSTENALKRVTEQLDRLALAERHGATVTAARNLAVAEQLDLMSDLDKAARGAAGAIDTPPREPDLTVQRLQDRVAMAKLAGTEELAAIESMVTLSEALYRADKVTFEQLLATKSDAAQAAYGAQVRMALAAYAAQLEAAATEQARFEAGTQLKIALSEAYLANVKALLGIEVDERVKAAEREKAVRQSTFDTLVAGLDRELALIKGTAELEVGVIQSTMGDRIELNLDAVAKIEAVQLGALARERDIAERRATLQRELAASSITDETLRVAKLAEIDAELAAKLLAIDLNVRTTKAARRTAEVAEATKWAQQEGDAAAEAARRTTEAWSQAITATNAVRMRGFQFQINLLNDWIAKETDAGTREGLITQRMALESQLRIAQARGESTARIESEIQTTDELIRLGQVRTTAMQRQLEQSVELQLQAAIASGDAWGVFGRTFELEIVRSSNTMEQLQAVARSTASASHQAWSNGFFVLMQGDFEALEDVAIGFLTAFERAIADFLASQVMRSFIGVFDPKVGMFSQGQGQGQGQRPSQISAGSFEELDKALEATTNSTTALVQTQGEAISSTQALSVAALGAAVALGQIVGTQLGGGGRGAAQGAQIGTAVGLVGGAVVGNLIAPGAGAVVGGAAGAVVGGIAGGLIGGASDDAVDEAAREMERKFTASVEGAFKTGLTTAVESGDVEAGLDAFHSAMRDAVIAAFIEGVVNAAIIEQAIRPMTDVMGVLFRDALAGNLTPEEFSALLQPTIDAMILTLGALDPFFVEMADILVNTLIPGLDTVFGTTSSVNASIQDTTAATAEFAEAVAGVNTELETTAQLLGPQEDAASVAGELQTIDSELALIDESVQAVGESFGTWPTDHTVTVGFDVEPFPPMPEPGGPSSMQHGGLATRPTVALVGEREPELIAPVRALLASMERTAARAAAGDDRELMVANNALLREQNGILLRLLAVQDAGRRRGAVAV